MTKQQKAKKISRRDAIKLLGAAAGATALSNLPSKWSKPELVSGVLPAHAQTSSLGLTILGCNLSFDIATGEWSSSPIVGPGPIPVTSIPMQFTITFVNTHFVSGSDPQSPNPYINNWNLDPSTGTVLYANSGNVTLPGIMAADSGAASGSVSILWEFLSPSHGSGTCGQTVNWSFSLPTVLTTAIIPNDPILVPYASFYGDVTDDGGSPVTERGFVFAVSPNTTPTISDNQIVVGSGTGAFQSLNYDTGAPDDKYGRAYAINAVGVAYGAAIAFTTGQCLVEGTLIAMADGTRKKIEEIEYSDSLLVWNFDEGSFDMSQPLWIKKSEAASQYLQFEFSDGTILKIVKGHRIFSKELGAFGYPMTEDAPIGTTTFNAKGEEVTLVGMHVVNEQVNFYNIITHHHMNLFADGILTSCRYNNIYPIADMKFVKDERTLVSQADYGVEDKYYEGLRLGEQTVPVEETVAYVNRLKAHEAESKVEAV